MVIVVYYSLLSQISISHLEVRILNSFYSTMHNKIRCLRSAQLGFVCSRPNADNIMQRQIETLTARSLGKKHLRFLHLIQGIRRATKINYNECAYI